MPADAKAAGANWVTGDRAQGLSVPWWASGSCSARGPARYSVVAERGLPVVIEQALDADFVAGLDADFVAGGR
jgi:hypothetical protein